MMFFAKDFEGTELMAAEILDYELHENNLLEVIVPAEDYPGMADLYTTDLIVIKILTFNLSYEGPGRIFETLPGSDGILLRIRLDTAYDIC